MTDPEREQVIRVTMKRCAAIAKRYADEPRNNIHQDVAGRTAGYIYAEIRALAPEPEVCVWHRAKKVHRYDICEGKQIGIEEWDELRSAGWVFSKCPNCGRPIQVKE